LSRKNKSIPLLENVEVIDAGTKGKNIARAGALVVLVDNAVPGDVADIQVYRKKKGFAEGKAVHFHKYSKDRAMPVCRHFDVCGGCSWQNMTYERQLHFKQKTVADALTRIGKLELPDISPIIGSDKTEYYRNRLDFAFSNNRWLQPEEMLNKEEFILEPGLGFHISGRFDKVLDIHRCYLQEDPSNPIRLAVREYALANDYKFFDLKNQHGSLRSLIIRTSTTGELMVLVIFYKESAERIKQLMEFVRNRFPAITSLYYILNPKANDTVYDLEHHLFFGKPELTEQINGIRYRIGPKSFFQTNSYQTTKLFDAALGTVDFTGNETVYDLYTGVGSIALQLAKRVKKVVGIETVAEAIEYAKVNAADNNISNADFYAGDVKDILNDDFIAEHGRPDVLVTDPPRVGMDASVVKKILELAPPKIIYVSCNPATQARDLDMMREKYKVNKVQPVDMFPHTYHVENIALLELI
jgi:23S rRNA (uracil1939-C5)-methyltransferase